MIRLNTKPRFNWKFGLALVLILLGILGYSIIELLGTVNDFFEGHYLQFNQVIQVTLKKPIEIKQREMLSPVVEYIELLDYPDEIDTEIEKYICEKFGQYECKTSLAIAKSESNLKEEAIHINSNGTIDLGVFQINSIHFDKPGCSLQELVFAKKNIDCAYNIWKAQGWSPWVVWRNKSFIDRYEK